MQQHALDNFKRVGVEVRTGLRVTEVRGCRRRRCYGVSMFATPAHPRTCMPRAVRSGAPRPPPSTLPPRVHAFLSVQVSKDTISLSTGEVMKYGVCVWSAGNAPRPLVQQLATQIPQQVRHLWCDVVFVARHCSVAAGGSCWRRQPCRLLRCKCVIQPVPQAELQPGGKPSKLVVDPFLRWAAARAGVAVISGGFAGVAAAAERRTVAGLDLPRTTVRQTPVLASPIGCPPAPRRPAPPPAG
jgi:hypothetical protein